MIAATDHPATAASLCDDLRRLGVDPGMTLMVHSSLSRLGFVVGGAHAVVEALLAAVGPEGTVMMPTHSSGLTDPASWRNPPVPEAWWPTIRDHMPAYDPQVTPTGLMGSVVECFLRVPGVRRSDHPTVSAAAHGPQATALVGDHSLDRGLGEGSPQARLYGLGGHILLLGVGHANNTSLHLAEHRAVPDGHPMLRQRSPMIVDGERVWVEHDELDEDNDFDRIGEAFADAGRQRTGPVGAGTAHLMRARDLVDFAAVQLRRYASEPGVRAPSSHDESST